MTRHPKALVFVSACLGGRPIRYNGSGVAMPDAIWARWEREERLFHFCPELASGFPYRGQRPRLSAEAPATSLPGPADA